MCIPSGGQQFSTANPIGNQGVQQYWPIGKVASRPLGWNQPSSSPPEMAEMMESQFLYFLQSKQLQN
jgi:hypothetical protein